MPEYLHQIKRRGKWITTTKLTRKQYLEANKKIRAAYGKITGNPVRILVKRKRK